MNSSSCGGLYKIKPVVTILTWRGEEMASGEGRVVFLKGMAPGVSTMFQWMTPYPGVYGQYKKNSMGY